MSPISEARDIDTMAHCGHDAHIHEPAFCQQAFDHAGIGVLLLDKHGKIQRMNAAAERAFGCAIGQVADKPLACLCAYEFQHLVSRSVQRTLQQHSVNHVDVALIPPGGLRLLHLGLVVSCVKDADDRCAGAAVWVRDISSSKEMESHLHRSAHMASLGTLAAGLAHHFNNIVCSMSAMVDLALSTEDPRAMRRALQMSAEAAGRISHITQTLVAFSAPDNHNADLSDLTEVLLHFVDTVEPTLSRRDIHLQLDLHAQRVAAVPRHLFMQIMHHLLSNAQDAIADRAAPDAAITIRTRSQGDQIMLQFGDTGLGIAPENLPRIFEPFFTTKGVQGGGSGSHPGLGLALVHSAVMDLGGHLWADTATGRGATINIVLPSLL